MVLCTPCLPWRRQRLQLKAAGVNVKGRGDVVEEAPAVAWDDIAGLEDAKRVLRDEAVLPLVMPELFQNVPILKPTKGVLLFGPPGTGKTLLAQAVATAAAAGAGQRTTFINVSPATITKCLRGESEKLTRLMFEVARALEPSVVFIDEIDALCSKRGAPGEHEASRRAKTELLTQMDGLASGCRAGPAPRVMLLGATNHPEHVDEALRRRLTKRIYIPLPGRQQREALLRLALRKVAVAPDIDVARLAARLEGNSCSDITGLVAAVGRAALRRMLHGEGLTMERSPPSALRPALERAQAELLHGAGLQPADFEAALRNHNPSVSMEDVARHERWAAQFGSR